MTAELLKRQADLLVSLGLRDAGYTFVNSDDAWMEQARDNATGRLRPTAAFGGNEDGMRNLSRYIHNKGLQFG